MCGTVNCCRTRTTRSNWSALDHPQRGVLKIAEATAQSQVGAVEETHLVLSVVVDAAEVDEVRVQVRQQVFSRASSR